MDDRSWKSEGILDISIQSHTATVHLSGTCVRQSQTTFEFTQATQTSNHIPARFVIKQHDRDYLLIREATTYELLESAECPSVPRYYGTVRFASAPGKLAIALEYLPGTDLLSLSRLKSPNCSLEEVFQGLSRCYSDLTNCCILPGDDELRHMLAIRVNGELRIKRIDFDEADVRKGPVICETRNKRAACNLHEDYASYRNRKGLDRELQKHTLQHLDEVQETPPLSASKWSPPAMSRSTTCPDPISNHRPAAPFHIQAL